ncbi:MAG: hypothetical protein KDA21_02230 [Phycisphaerales bacterium]|nr:hypothetical protein [Phycisphaerales bacterium]
MMRHVMLTAAAAIALTTTAFAQVENPDFQVRAKFRTPNDGSWAAGESVGDARFDVKSRFLQVYYGGVSRLDEYTFRVQLDFTDISGFDTHYVGSQYQVDWDVYINDGFVGRVMHDNEGLGISELKYDSRHPDPPATLIPEGFPDPVNVFDVVRVYTAAPALPEIGDPLPGGSPVFQNELIEEFARGDVNQDGHVDEDDFPFLAASYDPWHVLGDLVGPTAGDFTADNRCDLADYMVFLQNWDDSHDPPAEPLPVAFRVGDLDHDGLVGFNDLNLVLAEWGPCSNCTLDADGDGIIGFNELNEVLANWD